MHSSKKDLLSLLYIVNLGIRILVILLLKVSRAAAISEGSAGYFILSVI